MGFEIKYLYHERLEAGGYNKDETKEMKRKVGEAHDDVPLEKVATAVMQQLARRDIWVVGVEIAEFTKKKITFRETDGGIVIKNKKYLLDQTGLGGITVQDVPEPGQPRVPAVHPHQLPSVAAAPTPGRPQRKVMFMPSRIDLAKREMAKTGARLSVEKEYVVVHQFPSPSGVGLLCRVVDDRGQEVDLSDEFFVPAQMNLYADKELGFSKTARQSDGGTLNWQGAYDDQIPDIRGR
jgi:hypothetical protein